MIPLFVSVIMNMYQKNKLVHFLVTIIHHTGQVVKEKKNEMKGESHMDEKAREARREYLREWRKRNPDKVRENNRRYWERRAAKKAQAEQEKAAG